MLPAWYNVDINNTTLKQHAHKRYSLSGWSAKKHRATRITCILHVASDVSFVVTPPFKQTTTLDGSWYRTISRDYFRAKCLCAEQLIVPIIPIYRIRMPGEHRYCTGLLLLTIHISMCTRWVESFFSSLPSSPCRTCAGFPTLIRLFNEMQSEI